MRVSTSMLFDYGRNSMQRQTADFLHTQQQIASGRRIVTPSDDPAASARVLEVSQSQNVNKQYVENQGNAQDSLRLVDGTLSSVTDLITYVRTKVLDAGNGTYSQDELDNIASDLRAQFEDLRGLANTRDGEGNYLFSGYRLDTEPYAGDLGSGATTYEGDSNERRIQVSASRQMEVSAPGDQIFGSVFDDMRTLIDDLESGAMKNGKTDPGPPPVTLTGAEVIGQSVGKLDDALDRVLTQRAAVGSRLGELDALGNVASDYDLQYSDTLSRLQDVDYNEALSSFAKQQTLLQAAQQSYVQVTGLSLFNYLK